MDAILAGVHVPGLSNSVRFDRRGQGFDDATPPGPNGSEARLDNETWGAAAAAMFSGRNFGVSAPGASSGPGRSTAQNDPAGLQRSGSATAAAAARAVAVPVDLKQMVEELDAEVLRELVLGAAPSNPQLLRSNKDAHGKRKIIKSDPALTPTPKRSAKSTPKPTTTPRRVAIPLSQMVPVITFDHLSKDVWHALNNKGLLQLIRRRQAEKAEEVVEEALEYVDEIIAKAKPDSPLQTRRSAVETLRKIMKTVILTDGVAGDEMRTQQRRDNRMEQCIVELLTSMTPEERIAMGAKVEKEETFLEKVQWIREHQDKSNDRMYRLGDVVTMLKSGSCVVVLD